MPSSAKFAGRVLGQGVLALFALYYFALLAAVLRGVSKLSHLDFFTFLRAGMKVRAGQPIFSVDHVTGATGTVFGTITLQHPLVAVVFAPLSALDPPAAYRLWFGISLAAWLLAVALTLRATATPPAWRLPIVLVAVALPGLQWDLIYGQIACLLALLLVVGWLLARGERWFLAGVVVGMAAMLKVLLAPLALPLLLRGRGRAAGGLALGAATSVLIAVPWTGWRAFPDWLATLRRVSWLDAPGNLSIHAYLTRALGTVPPSWAVAGVSLLTVVVSLVVLARPVPGVPDISRLYGGLIAVCILGSPLGWGNYVLFLLPLWGVLLESRLARWRRRTAVVATALLWLPDLGIGWGPWLDPLRTLALILFVVALASSPVPAVNGAVRFLTRRRLQPV
jgi:alpha-1,2-mannosyltransferase